MVHVVDTDEELMWTDDHNPPVPTTQWKAGQTVEYTQNRVRSHLPVRRRRRHSHRVVFDDRSEARAAARTGHGAARLQGGDHQPAAADREPVHGLQGRLASGRSGRFERGGRMAVDQEGRRRSRSRTRRKTPCCIWSWTARARHSMAPSRCRSSWAARRSIRSPLQPDETMLRKVALPAARMGDGELTELQVSVDKTFVPVLVSNSNSKDKRELGVRVFHAFVDSR